MKILLTGEPRSGKTTLLEDFIEAVPDKQGFLTEEVREDGKRVGFELVSSHGQTATLASMNSDSPIRVSRYGVEVDRLDEFIATLPTIKTGSLLYIDEIGQMELFSDAFKKLIIKYLDAENHYAGTITSVYKDSFIEEILSRNEIVLLKINQDNREQMRDILGGLAANIPLLQRLSPTVQSRLAEMARDYAETGDTIQLKKLFTNTIKYLAEKRVDRLNSTSFEVKGNTKEHLVSNVSSEWVCDCDLFNVRDDFENNAGECSHVQTVKLTILEPTK